MRLVIGDDGHRVYKDICIQHAPHHRDLGVIVDHADNYALALSNTAHDDQVELHCINKANGQQVVMQASHSTDLYPAVICSNGIIFRNFITPGLLPDGFFD